MELANALWITLIGMGLVFIAIVLLWGLMALLVRVTEEKNGQQQGKEVEALPEAAADLISDAIPDAALLLDRKRRAAAAAVAVALGRTAAQKRLLQAAEEHPAGMVSSWQAVNRASQISQRINASRKKVIR